METPALHKKETKRLEKVESFSFFKSKNEKSFDVLTSFVAEYFNVDMCGVSIVSENSVYSKVNSGIDPPKFPRNYSICGHAILEGSSPLVIKDLKEDFRFNDNHLFIQSFGMRFYAACSLLTKGRLPIGTFWVMSKKPRVLSEGELNILNFFSEKCMEIMTLRKTGTSNSEGSSDLLKNTKDELIRYLLIYRLNKASLSLKNSSTNSTFLLAQASITQKYIRLKELGNKTSFSLGTLLESSLASLPLIKPLVSFGRDLELIGSQDYLKLALNYVLEFTACKNQYENIRVSSMKHDSQSIIVISSKNGGFDKEEQKNLFTLNLEYEAHFSVCKGMEIPFAKQIIELHNGSIQIYSAQNAGLSFYISLPNS